MCLCVFVCVYCVCVCVMKSVLFMLITATAAADATASKYVTPSWDMEVEGNAFCVNASLDGITPHQENNSRWTWLALPNASDPATPKPAGGWPVYLAFTPWVRAPTADQSLNKTCGNGWSPEGFSPIESCMVSSWHTSTRLQEGEREREREREADTERKRRRAMWWKVVEKIDLESSLCLYSLALSGYVHRPVVDGEEAVAHFTRQHACFFCVST